MTRAVSVFAGFGALIALFIAQSFSPGLAAPPAVPGAAPVLTPPQAMAPVTLIPPGSTARYRGTIAEVNGPFLTLKTVEHKSVTIGVTETTRVIHNRMYRLAELQPGWYAAIAAIRGTDGKFRASGIRIYSDGVHGEGAYPADATNPIRFYVNGTIATVMPGGAGGTLTVTFTGGTADASGTCLGRAMAGGCSGKAEVLYARGVPIVSVESGDATLLQPGATVSVQAAPDASGTPVAAAITVERDAPPPKP
jgi:hypothetical protein